MRIYNPYDDENDLPEKKTSRKKTAKKRPRKKAAKKVRPKKKTTKKVPPVPPLSQFDIYSKIAREVILKDMSRLARKEKDTYRHVSVNVDEVDYNLECRGAVLETHSCHIESDLCVVFHIKAKSGEDGD